ncbi:hypothetical protein C7414_105320 [Cupriavidus alkaliphilus]|uniref:CatB-related O-acetyltransferase n=1 Tax=Cupriavidus alkaliphilus TaxID=942866 RepID=UPI000DE7B083|nr:CatB-related O-acetyltransferase [Cupriavidus alkaliphilus]PVY79637.1 hypothetical protein C7414_105320 [Cupriavidus alkaliphilus]
MSGNPFFQLARYGIEIIDPIGSRLRGDIEFEPYVWLGTGWYELGKIGSFSYIGENASILSRPEIGRFCSIARNIIIGEAEHPMDFLSTSPVMYSKRYWKDMDYVADYYDACAVGIKEAAKAFEGRYPIANQSVAIGNDVWIGEGVFIRRGVKIGDGAIIGSRSIVNKDVEPYSVVAGAPARRIRMRFSDSVIEKLLSLKWWNYDIRGFGEIPFHDIERAIDKLFKAVGDGLLKEYKPPVYIWNHLPEKAASGRR